MDSLFLEMKAIKCFALYIAVGEMKIESCKTIYQYYTKKIQ